MVRIYHTLIVALLLTAWAACSNSSTDSPRIPAFKNILGASRFLGTGAASMVLDHAGARLVAVSSASGATAEVSLAWDVPLHTPIFAELITTGGQRWVAAVVERTPSLQTRIVRLRANTENWVTEPITTVSGWIQLYGFAGLDVIWGSPTKVGVGTMNILTRASTEPVQWINYDPYSHALYGLSGTASITLQLDTKNQTLSFPDNHTLIRWHAEAVTVVAAAAATAPQEFGTSSTAVIYLDVGKAKGTVFLDTTPLAFVAATSAAPTAGWLQHAAGGWMPVQVTEAAVLIPAPYHTEAAIAGLSFDDKTPYSNPSLIYARATTPVVVPAQKITLKWQANLADYVATDWPPDALQVNSSIAGLLRIGDTVAFGSFSTVVTNTSDSEIWLANPWPGGRPGSLVPVGRWVLAGELDGLLDTVAMQEKTRLGSLELLLLPGSDAVSTNDSFQFFYNNGFKFLGGTGLTFISSYQPDRDTVLLFDRQQGSLSGWHSLAGEQIWEIY